MPPPEKRRVDVGDVSLLWGDPAECKAELRRESLERLQSQPIEERLRMALALVLRRDSRVRRAP